MALEKTWRWFGVNDSVTLSQLKQIGIEGIVTSLHHIPNGEVWTKEEIMKVKCEIESWGMRWSVVESLPVSEGIKTCSADRCRLIENYKRSIRNLGECGIDTVCYNFMPVLDWARTDLHYKDKNGAESMLFDYLVFTAFDIHILKRPSAADDYPQDVRERARVLAENMTDEEKEKLAHNIIVVTQGFINGTVGDVEDYKQLFLKYLEQYKDIDSGQLRKNLSAFLSDVLPVAEKWGVNMAIHPDDPPFPLLGLPRIASTIDDFKWIVEQYDSIANGITLCTGSLSAREDNDLVEFVKQLGEKIHFVHLRNTQRLNGRSFYESGHLEGSIDMYEVVKALLEEQKRRIRKGRKDVRMPFRPDHGLRILDDYNRKANPGYPLIGRMKGMAEICGLEMGIEKADKACF
ncbi:mannonate dehydratase [Prevotella sp. 10(H)]|uniref:mannonate dehydratase n=1 Tax=Prevotella sp. 10(H) TaxID=1158294 RepID=UPI0004A6F6CD|nr:mannonate dehydratase [Prevotella sp. 10(H)]